MLRERLAPWTSESGLKRLGDRAWIRPHEDGYVILAVQCRQSGWDPRAGSSFVVELERSQTPKVASSYDRVRLWQLLDEIRREEAVRINDRVAQTLPPPDRAFVSTLPDDVREHYLLDFSPSTDDSEASDVWFRYYDESDAVAWGEFLLAALPQALEMFLHQTPPVARWGTPGT